MNRMRSAITIVAAAFTFNLASAQDDRAADDLAAQRQAQMERFRLLREKSEAAIADFELTDDEISELIELGISDANLESLRERAKYGFPRFKEPGRAYVVLPLREPISREDIQVIVDTLKLSEGQQKVLDQRYLEYVSSARQLWTEHAGPLWSRAADYAVMREWTQEKATFAEELHSDAARAESRFRAADNEFLESLRPMLAEEQQPLMERVKLMRERAATVYPNVGASDIDLAALHRSMLSEDKSRFTPTDAAAFEQALIQHERRFTALYRDFVTEQAKSSVAQANYIGAPDEAKDALRAEHKRLALKQVETDRKMHESVMRAASHLGEHLSQEAAREWLARVRILAFPVLYQPFDDPAGDLLTDWIQDEESGWPAETLEALRTIRNDHDRRLAAANRAMEEPYLEWTIYRNSGGYRPAEYWPYQDELITRMKSRMNVLRSTLNAARSIVPDQAEAIDSVMAAIDSTETALSDAKGEPNGHGWPGPTDGYRWHLQRLETEKRNTERRKQMEEMARRRHEQQDNDDGGGPQ